MADAVKAKVKNFSMHNVRDEIQKFINEFKAHGRKFDCYEFTCRLIDNHPQHVSMFVEMVLEQLPKAGTFFHDAISFTPEHELPRLAGLAIAMLRKGGPQETAEDFIARCSLQRVDALHPFLADIYELQPNWSTYYSDWPWRKSGLLHFEFLQRLVEDASNAEASQDAWRMLLETRHPAILKYCAEHTELDGGPADADFREAGFELRDRSLRQLYSDDVRHLVFPDAYWKQKASSTPVHMAKRHPTWRSADIQISAPSKFGGLGTHTCAACGKQGHHLFSLDSVPKELAISGLTQVQFETCLSCLGWDVPRMFYRHDSSGKVTPVGYKGGHLVPQFPARPFIQTEIHLAPTPRRWQWQDWSLTNSRQNLHRLGGFPCWIQNAEYLQCPLCHATMNFLFQLDSDLLTGSENSKRGEFLWGSGGICYGQWCDQCKVSGYLWQCT